MMKRESRIAILERALSQREALLVCVAAAAEASARQADCGWMLTLGAPQIGMLMAVNSGQSTRKMVDLATTLQVEIATLKGQLFTLNVLASDDD
jgi:hypothetical protein